MVFNFDRDEKPFVPKEGGIFDSQSPIPPLWLQEGENDRLPIINASWVPTATWIVPWRVEDTLNKEKK